jgi:hypothetical protein
MERRRPASQQDKAGKREELGNQPCRAAGQHEIKLEQHRERSPSTAGQWKATKSTRASSTAVLIKPPREEFLGNSVRRVIFFHRMTNIERIGVALSHFG